MKGNANGEKRFEAEEKLEKCKERLKAMDQAHGEEFQDLKASTEEAEQLNGDLDAQTPHESGIRSLINEKGSTMTFNLACGFFIRAGAPSPGVYRVVQESDQVLDEEEMEDSRLAPYDEDEEGQVQKEVDEVADIELSEPTPSPKLQP